MRSTRSLVLGLVVLAVFLPLSSHGGAGEATCCNLAASFAQNLFPGGSGDEDFFTVPGGPPNVMILLDNSGSMLNFPQPLDYSGLTANGQGTCSVAAYEDAATARLTAGLHSFETRSVFTDGTSNSPAWVTENCRSNSNNCLFHADGYYHYSNVPTTTESHPGGVPWTATSASRSATAANACAGLSGAAQTACTGCLASKGYYVYLDSGGERRAAFTGAFLNVFPPKFIIARKVLKDMFSIDPAGKSVVDRVRFGLVTFNGSSGGTMNSRLLPSCEDSIGAAADAKFIDARNALMTAVDAVPFSAFQVTPLAETLFDIAQYYSDGANSDGSGSSWLSWFSSSYWKSAFWNKTGATTSNDTSSFCWACQQSSVIVISDGAPRDDNSLPSSTVSADHTSFFDSAGKGDFTRWKGGRVGASQKLEIDCADCGTDIADSSKSNLLHLVAAFMRFNDLRKDPPASGANSTQMAGAQNVSTYTIGVNLDATSTAVRLLEKTAELGGGSFVNSSSADELANAVFGAVTNVINKTTSFSVSNTNTLQSSTAAQLFTARFRPLDRLGWEGHLYRLTLFNELALGCDPTKTHAAQTLIPASANAGACTGKNPNFDGVETGGLADCSRFYIVDEDCDPVMEDPTTGLFKKAHFSATGALVEETGDADPFWDAGQVLSTPGETGYRSADEGSASKRKIYTVLDNDTASGDGLLTAADSKVEFTVANVASIAPYLALDGAWCTRLFNRLGFTQPASWDSAAIQKCAKQVIWYVRGFDVLDEDEDGCAGPGGLNAAGAQTPKACTTDDQCSPGGAGACSSGQCVCKSGTKGEERDAPNGHWKLGDIFHSSPVSVDPPFSEFICDIGRGQTQCVATIHSPSGLSREVQTEIEVNAASVDAYEQWRAASTAGVVNRERTRIVLAGGNDGMLHAFHAGEPNRASTADAFGTYPYDFGTGEELWAFIPMDLLPELKYALDGHQYFVDGNVMVRDIWHDGNADRKKQSSEFHTIAILSERGGGSQFVALDVTNPLDPTFRWTFPQLCSLEQNLVGQSWTDFAPRPPPIGPVKLALPSGVTDAKGRNFEERWVAMLNGGYDPAGTKGRGVFMVDAWNGAVLWQFGDADFQAVYAATTPAGTTRAGMYPVPGSPGLVDIGNADQAVLDSDGYFDTATWGDMGGQLWVARFQRPGTLGTNGKVTNWFAARAMEQLRQEDGGQPFWYLAADGVTKQFRNEFYRMTANIWEPTSATLRTFLGSGNRDKLLTVGPSCGPSNFLGCAQSDCGVVKLTNTTEVGSCRIVSQFFNNNNQYQHNSTTFTGCDTTGPLACGTGVKVRIDMNLNNCPGTTKNPADVAATLTCNSSGACSDRTHIGKDRDLSSKILPAVTSHNRFYGVWAYSSARSFATASQAKGFDLNRFTDIPYPDVCAGPAGNRCTLIDTTQASVAANGAVTCGGGVAKCAATATDPGWFYEYGRTCPTADCPTAPPWIDEKTGSGATVLGSCVDWNTIRPMGSSVTGTPCSAGSGLPLNYTYLADSITGTPTKGFCGFAGTSGVVRATSRSSIAPPLDPTPIVSVSSSGVVRQSALQIEPGAIQQKDLAQRSESTQPVYWLEVPRDLHVCRHEDAAVCR